MKPRSRRHINPTIALTFILLTMMAGAGFVSGSWGYAKGREALRGITQPETQPDGGQGLASQLDTRDEVPFLNEDDVIAEIKARMESDRTYTARRPANDASVRPVTNIETPAVPAPSAAEATQADAPSAAESGAPAYQEVDNASPSAPVSEPESRGDNAFNPSEPDTTEAEPRGGAQPTADESFPEPFTETAPAPTPEYYSEPYSTTPTAPQ
jgi:hypothetical protein